MKTASNIVCSGYLTKSSGIILTYLNVHKPSISIINRFSAIPCNDIIACSSHFQSPFHEATRNTPALDLTEFQPLNFIRSDGTMTRYNFSAKSEKVANKASKRSRTNTPTHEDSKNSELRNDLVSMLKPIDDDDDEDQVYNFFISLN